MARWMRILLLVVAMVAAAQWWPGRDPAEPLGEGAAPPPAAAGDAGASAPRGQAPAPEARAPPYLPPEALATLRLIERGGPFPYERDGTVFQNRERLLPQRPRGYYREYTVRTPGSRDRGARRIVAGGDPPDVYYYTDDHYRSFRRVEVPP